MPTALYAKKESFPVDQNKTITFKFAIPLLEAPFSLIGLCSASAEPSVAGGAVFSALGLRSNGVLVAHGGGSSHAGF